MAKDLNVVDQLISCLINFRKRWSHPLECLIYVFQRNPALQKQIMKEHHQTLIKGNLRLFGRGWPKTISNQGGSFRLMLTKLNFYGMLSSYTNCCNFTDISVIIVVRCRPNAFMKYIRKVSTILPKFSIV